uniref:CCHC-type domain-containing protein n=1 Tax=Brassica oleracea var. oleracea TaxID=109376 RepID=A0A0D2ZPN6_BRAOL
MPPKKDVQQQLDAQTEAIQGALATFQLELRDSLQTSFEAALRTWKSKASVEELLTFKQVPDDMRVSMVATRFRGRASSWWQHVKEQRVRAGKERIASWEKLKRLLRKAFLPYNYTRTVINWCQGSSGGLRQQIQNNLLLFNPNTVSEAHQRAVFIEQNLRTTPTSWSSANTRVRSTNSTNTTGGSNTKSTAKDNPVRGNDQNNADGPSRVTRPATFKSFNCGEIGHRQSNCPKRIFLSNEEVIYDEEIVDEQTETEQEELVSGDMGHLLVFRRTLMSPQVIDESWLRSNIFRSSCTIRGKVCRFIVDSGSCTNVISEEAVAKLALFAEPHPNPYKLIWLNTQTDIRVSRQCKVPFSALQLCLSGLRLYGVVVLCCVRVLSLPFWLFGLLDSPPPCFIFRRGFLELSPILGARAGRGANSALQCVGSS